MTLGVGIPDRDYREPQHALEGRALSHALSGGYGGGDSDASFHMTTGADPSDGANVSGGSSYVEGMPLTLSSAGLAGVLGATPWYKRGKGKPVKAPVIRDVRAGSLSYEEAMDWVPSPLTAQLGALEAGPFKVSEADLRPGFGATEKSVFTAENLGWVVLLGGFAWWFSKRV